MKHIVHLEQDWPRPLPRPQLSHRQKNGTFKKLFEPKLNPRIFLSTPPAPIPSTFSIYLSKFYQTKCLLNLKAANIF
jgi:hypothetical protein